MTKGKCPNNQAPMPFLTLTSKIELFQKSPAKKTQVNLLLTLVIKRNWWKKYKSTRLVRYWKSGWNKKLINCSSSNTVCKPLNKIRYEKVSYNYYLGNNWWSVRLFGHYIRGSQFLIENIHKLSRVSNIWNFHLCRYTIDFKKLETLAKQGVRRYSSEQ